MWVDVEDGDSGDIHLSGTDENSPVLCSKHQAVNITKYLLKISGAPVPGETKLAALLFLNQMFEQDTHQIARFASMEHNLLPVLLELMDDFIHPEDKAEPLVTQCPTLSAMLCQNALKLFWHLSQLPIGQQQTLITEPVLRRLLSFIDPRQTKIYQFPSTMCKKLRSCIQGKTLFAQVKRQALNADVLGLIKAQTDRHTSKTFSHKLSLPDTVYRCVLYDTSDPKEDINIGVTLIDEHLAWRDMFVSKTDDTQTAMEETEVHVLQAIRGQLFWAHVGEMNQYVKIVQELHANMMAQSDSVSGITAPNVGDCVMVRRHPEGSAVVSFYYRGRIAQSRGDNFDLFAIDLGVILSPVSISSLYHLPPEVSVESYPPLASLCLLDGVQPPASYPILPQLAAASLVNLCRYSVPAGEIFVKTLSGLSVLYALLRCPDKRISIQAVQFLNNLACNTSVQKHLQPKQTLPQLLEIMKSGILNESDELNVSLNEACLVTLSTLLTIGKSYRHVFYKCEGLAVVLLVLSRRSSNDNTYSLVIKLLRIYLWNAPLSSYGSKKDRMARMLGDRGCESEGELLSARNITSRRNRSRSLSRHEEKKSVKRSQSIGDSRLHEVQLSEHRLRRHSSDSEDETPSDLFRKIGTKSSKQQRQMPSPAAYKNSPPVTTQVRKPVSMELYKDVPDPSDSHLAIIMSLGTTEEHARMALRAGGNNVDKATEWVLENVEWLIQEAEGIDMAEKDSDVGVQSPTVPVDATSNYIGSEKYYVVESVVDFVQDSHNELRTNMSITHASTEVICKIVCGFLNSGVEGRIVFGVRADGRVHGVSVTREERDQFRLGVDRMMVDKLQPALLHSMFDITYCPVVRPQGHADHLTRKPLRDVFVVEISLKPIPGSLYTLRNGECYYRIGSQTVHLKTQDIRQMIIMEEEALCKSEIHKLKKDLDTLKQVVKEHAT